MLLATLLLVLPAFDTTFSADEVQEDLALLRDALEALHPGLERHGTREEFARHWAALEHALDGDHTRREVYLEVSRFLATLRCGHTYANFWNQPDETRVEVLDRPDKLPFTFHLVEDRMLVRASALDDPRVVPGLEVLSIDGQAIDELVAGLLPFVHADGANDAQRRAQLELTGAGRFEWFDVFHPLAYPPRAEGYVVEARAAQGEPFRFLAPGVTRAQRAARLGLSDVAPDGTWEFRFLDDELAYLRLGSFVTWKMTLDWRGFLDDAFAELRERGTPHLVLDVRGNAGGDDAVLDALLDALLFEPVELPATRERVRYRRVPPRLDPHLGGWDDALRDLGERVEPAEPGYFRAVDADDGARLHTPRPDAYRGEVVVLMGPANSSATFTLVRTLRAAGRATLVGRPSGGNLRGTNGGQLFFLTLPHTLIEVDLPLIAWFPVGEAPDAGVEPDLLVEPTVADVRAGVDTALAAARALVGERRSSERD